MEDRGTQRIAFTVQYDGSSFFGWQLQREERTVQGELESVLSRLFAAPARIVGSGRTDRGVHAMGQVAAVDAPEQWSPRSLRRAMNALLPDEVWISAAAEVADDFHPRYNALERSYIYRIGLSPAAFSPFHARWCWPLAKTPQLDLLQEAAQAIVGDHSFKAFAKAGQEHRGDRCIVTSTGWNPWADIGFEFRVSANRYLHHMVRYLVGTLVDIGLERRPLDTIGSLLESAPGLTTSVPAPPTGLYLSQVRYPEGAYAPVEEATWKRTTYA